MCSSGSSVTSSSRLLVKVKSTTTNLPRFWVPNPLLSWSVRKASVTSHSTFATCAVCPTLYVSRLGLVRFRLLAPTAPALLWPIRRGVRHLLAATAPSNAAPAMIRTTSRQKRPKHPTKMGRPLRPPPF